VATIWTVPPIESVSVWGATTSADNGICTGGVTGVLGLLEHPATSSRAAVAAARPKRARTVRSNVMSHPLLVSRDRVRRSGGGGRARSVGRPCSMDAGPPVVDRRGSPAVANPWLAHPLSAGPGRDMMPLSPAPAVP
jgi:hypothetical protein